ncbi:UNVERIFIED_CONTAM: hypothetical protein H355_014202 [Colinus virginianus]|nr:hypothetical protein H355_014202 [Colinus virginianus]
MLPYRKCRTWEFSEKTVGLDFRDEPGCCVTATGFCRVSARDTAATRSAGCQYGPLRRAFPPVSSSRELLAAAGVGPPKTAPLVAETTFRSSTEHAGTLLESACAAREPAAVSFNVTSGEIAAVHRAAGVIRASAAHVSVAVSAAYGQRGSPSGRCYPLLRKHRSFESWFTPGSVYPPFPSVSTEISQQHPAVAVADRTRAAVATAHPPRGEDRVQTLSVETVTRSDTAASEGAPAARPGTTAERAAAETAAARGATYIRSGGASAPAGVAGAIRLSGGGQPTERNAEATALTTEDKAVPGKPEGSRRSCGQRSSSCYSPPDVFPARIGGNILNTRVCQKEQSEDGPAGSNASYVCLKGPSISVRVAADVGNRGDNGEPVPLLQQHGSQLFSGLQREAAFAVQGAQESPRCSPAPTLPPAQEAAPVCVEAATTTAPQPAPAAALRESANTLPAGTTTSATAAAAGPDTEESQYGPLFGTSATAECGECSSMKYVPEASREAHAVEERNDAKDACGGPSSLNSSSHRLDSSASIASSGSDLLSDEERNKQSLFQSIGMNVPVGGCKKKNQGSAEKRSGSASAPAAYDSFASTCPHSLSFVSSHSLSLAYYSPSVTLPVLEGGPIEECWRRSSEHSTSGIGSYSGTRGTSDMHQVVLNSRARRATCPTLRRSGDLHEKSGQLPGQHELPFRTRSARRLRSLCTPPRQDAESVAQWMVQLQQDERDERLQEPLREHKEASQQYHEDCAPTRKEQMQYLAPEERRRLTKPRLSEHQQLGVFNSGNRTFQGSKVHSPPTKRDSTGVEGRAGGKYNLADFTKDRAVAPGLPEERKEFRQTPSMVDNGARLRTSAVHPIVASVSATHWLAASVTGATLAETEAAVEPAGAKKTALGTANVAAPLDVSEATEGCETRGERGTHGAAGVGYMGAAPLDSLGPGQIESRAETAAEIVQPADSVSPSGRPSDQVCFSAAREVHRNERPNSESHSGPSAWERRSRCSLACSTVAARNRSRLPLALADRTDEALIEQSVPSSQQFAVATSETADLPIQSTTSTGEEVVTEVGGAALAAVQGKDADVDAASVHFTSHHTSGCSRRSSPSLPARFTSVPACGNDIPVIQLFTAEGEDQGRPTGDSVEENMTRQPAFSGPPPAGVANDESVKVSVSPPKRRHRLPSVGLCEAGAIGDEDVCTRTLEERESRSGVRTTLRMAPLSGLSPRTSELLGPEDGRGHGFDDGHYIKKEAIAGSTSMVYGRYLGITDISAGQSTASPSTVSTVSPYSYSGFSSSCSLLSSTCVLGSQVCGSAGAAVVSPSPAGTRVDEFFLTASSSSGGSEDSCMPASVDDNLPVSSYRSPVQSYENCASSPAPPAAHDHGGQEAAEFARVGAGTPNAAGSARACTPRPTDCSFHGATSTTAGADHAAIATTAGRNPAVSARAPVSQGAREETADSSEGGPECAAPPLTGRTSNSACEREPKEESARQRSLWKSSVRKMFSSKALLRWKSAFSAVASKSVGAVHPAVNRELVAATEKQEQLPHDADSAAAHRGFCSHGLLPPPEPGSVPATTSGRLRAAATTSASRKCTTETSPLKRNVPMTPRVETSTKTHRESEYKAEKSAKGEVMHEPSPARSEGQRDLEQQQQVDPYQERRQEPHKAEKQQERQPRRVSSGFQEDQLQVCQQYKLHSQTQQAGQQEHGDKEQGKERMCAVGTAEEATVAGIYSRLTYGGRRGGEGVAEGEEVREKATDGTREARCSGSSSSSWVPLSHSRERKQLHSGQLQHSRELRKEAQWQTETQQAGGRIEVTGDLQTKHWTQVRGISSQLLQDQYQRHVSEREERPLRRGAQGEYETQAEQHPQQPIVVKQPQEGSRDVPATCALDGGYEGELLLRQEACQGELRGSARDCRVERSEQQLTTERRRRRGTQDLKQESFEVTQQWDRLGDNEDRWLTERREQPHEGGNTHPLDGPRGDEASGKNDLSARTETFAVLVASTSATSPSLFCSYPGSIPYAPSSREAATALPSAAQTLECRQRQRLEHQVAAAAAAPTESSKVQCCMGESARAAVPEDVEEAKRYGDTAAVRSVYTADNTVLPARLAIPHAEDTMRVRTAAAAAPGADGSGQLRTLETASQPLGHEKFSAIRRGADTSSESCAAGEQSEDNRSGFLDATQEVSVLLSGSISPRASRYHMRSALQTSIGTESRSSCGFDKANQDPQQKLGFSECSHSGHPGNATMHGTPKHQQQLRRCLSHAETLNNLSGTTLRDVDFDVRRYDAAETTDRSRARCSALGENAEQKAEECYRQKLASVFSFRLVVVGIVLLLVQVMHIVGGAVRTGYLWGNHHEEHAWFRVSAAGDAAQLALYVILGLRGHIHGSKSSLEMWTCALFSLVDKYTEGNSLRLMGEVQLSPLVRPDGLRCERRVLRRFLHSVQRHLTYTDEICLCVAALAHDIGHPGLTNQYLISSQSLLATTYNDIAVLENYHAACCFRTAGYSEELNIFAGLSQEVYSYMRQNIIGLILATDMSKHISYISRLRGDEERRQGLPVIENFDRRLAHRFPQSQFRFIQVVVSPLIEALVDVEALLKGRGGVLTIICRHLSNNRRKWKMLAVAAGYVHSTEEDEEAADEDEEDTDEQETTTERPPAREENGVCNARERRGGEEIDSRGIAD